MKTIKNEYIITPVGCDETSYNMRKSGESTDKAKFIRHSQVLNDLFGNQGGILTVIYEAKLMNELGGVKHERQ